MRHAGSSPESARSGRSFGGAGGGHAVRRFLEFFAASIRNRNTRMAYCLAACQFFAWVERHGRLLSAPLFQHAHTGSGSSTTPVGVSPRFWATRPQTAAVKSGGGFQRTRRNDTVALSS